MLTAVFPSGVLVPVDFNALRRLASNCLIVAIELSLQIGNTGRNSCTTKSLFLLRTATILSRSRKPLHTVAALAFGAATVWSGFWPTYLQSLRAKPNSAALLVN